MGDPVRRIGRYELHGRIGSGGMASVHLGRVSGAVGFARVVAIKRLHPHLAADPESLAPFVDEARLAARVRHPNVISTIDVVTADGELFVVMEYVPGASAAHLARDAVKRGTPIPPRVASAIVAGVLHGLHAAHEAEDDQGRPLGIVHRDVSPQNVLVGADGVARVLDFGIAKARSRLEETPEGEVKGKLAYMAPEQLGGREVTRAADVYGASVVLWELLAGRRLFRGKDDAILVEQVLLGDVAPPGSVAANVPPELDAIVLTGLASDPRRRFATASEMALALERDVELAMPSEVAAWVAEIAGASLIARAAEVRAVEAAAVPDEARARGQWIAEVRSSRRPAMATRRAGRGLLFGLLAAALVSAGAGVALLGGKRAGADRAPPIAPREAVVAAAVPGPTAPVSSPAASAPAIVVAPPADEAPSARPPRAKPPAPKTTKPVAKAAQGACSPPYTREPDGRIQWKRECL